jgi:hypothetical protein
VYSTSMCAYFQGSLFVQCLSHSFIGVDGNEKQSCIIYIYIWIGFFSVLYFWFVYLCVQKKKERKRKKPES